MIADETNKTWACSDTKHDGSSWWSCSVLAKISWRLLTVPGHYSVGWGKGLCEISECLT